MLLNQHLHVITCQNVSYLDIKRIKMSSNVKFCIVLDIKKSEVL